MSIPAILAAFQCIYWLVYTVVVIMLVNKSLEDDNARMAKNRWDEYFYSHYQPSQGEWGYADLVKYKTWYAPWITYISKTFNISFKDSRVLELGCGIGAVSSLLLDAGANVTGSDISAQMVKHARRVSPAIPFEVYDVMKQYPKKHLFNYVLAFEVLEHIPKLPLALNNIHKLLKKDGIFIGSTPYPYPKNMLDRTHVHVHHPGYWRNTFANHGFTDIHTVPLSVLPYFWKVFPGVIPIIPWYVSVPYVVSTTVIVARKK